MEENNGYFVEWLEEFVSQERGSRIVHYLLKNSDGKTVLAVVGTERSLRHMVYVVAEEFLEYSGPDCQIQAGFKWRSRREVVDWLTSMLAKNQQSDSPNGSTQSLGLNAQRFSFADKIQDLRVRNLKQSYSDIVWLGAAWTCGKQLRHYPAFCRNGTTIAAQSFVFVMAKEENRYVAYLEDMYEDKKGQKKVKVRWFHHSQEVKGVVRLRNTHPKEVYITPYTQVISVECVDGPAVVLTREHFEKCIGTFPDGLLGKVHLCFRQFRSNKIKPFDLCKLRGYFDQPLISCLESDTFLNSDSGVKVLRREESLGKAGKRKRYSGDLESFLTHPDSAEGLKQKRIMRAPLPRSGYSDMFDKKLLSFRDAESQRWHTRLFKVNDNVELLCQDSGIRGCWFKCNILEISRKQMKLQYKDVEDEDGCGKLEEWVPAFRLAAPDKLGMRCLGRPTIRPFPPISNSIDVEFEVGDPADAWWSDGWWEGVITAVDNPGDSNLQVYIPAENLFLNVPRKDLRVSRDWIGGKWVDVKANRDILSAICPNRKPLPLVSIVRKDEEVGLLAVDTKVDGNKEKEATLAVPASSTGHAEQLSSSDKDNQENHDHVNEKSDNISTQDMCCDANPDNNGDNQILNAGDDDAEREDRSRAEVTAELSEEGRSDAEGLKAGEVDEETLQVTDVTT